MTHVEARWHTMGCDAAVWLTGDRSRADLDALVARIRADVEDVATRLTRFDAASELCRLNADPRTVVPASTVMRRFVLAARGAGVLTEGLVDATRLDDLERAGYVDSVDPAAAPLRPASAPPARAPSRAAAAPSPAAAPARAAAGAHPARAYLKLEAGIAAVVRPAGVRLDSGGIGKGLAADLAARRVPAGVRYAISIGGDLAVGGPGPQHVDVLRAVAPPAIRAARLDTAGPGRGRGRGRGPAGRGTPVVEAAHTHGGQPRPPRAAGGAEAPRVVVRRAVEVVHRLEVAGGGVATSGIHVRAWTRPDGTPAHHLIDPATGEPAWTGLVAVTAVGADAVEAEALAKAALLSGPAAAAGWLRRRGGVLQHEDGTVEVVAPRAARAAA